MQDEIVNPLTPGNILFFLMEILCSISAVFICTAFFQECNPGIKRDLPVVFNFQGLGGIPFAF